MEVLLIIWASLVACLAFIMGWVYIAQQFERIAKMKGHYEKRYFWLSFFLTIIGWMLVIALPDRGQNQKQQTLDVPPLVKNDKQQ